MRKHEIPRIAKAPSRRVSAIAATQAAIDVKCAGAVGNAPIAANGSRAKISRGSRPCRPTCAADPKSRPRSTANPTPVRRRLKLASRAPSKPPAARYGDAGALGCRRATRRSRFGRRGGLRRRGWIGQTKARSGERLSDSKPSFRSAFERRYGPCVSGTRLHFGRPRHTGPPSCDGSSDRNRPKRTLAKPPMKRRRKR
jgi:hypothetical protein